MDPKTGKTRTSILFNINQVCNLKLKKNITTLACTGGFKVNKEVNSYNKVLLKSIGPSTTSQAMLLVTLTIHYVENGPTYLCKA